MLKIFTTFYQFHIELKAFHFQTKSYSAHKASDQLYTQLNLLFDKFLEVYQGIHGQFKSLNTNITLKSWNNPQVPINKFIRFLRKLKLNDSSLINIREEILTELHQFLYLLNFH